MDMIRPLNTSGNGTLPQENVVDPTYNNAINASALPIRRFNHVNFDVLISCIFSHCLCQQTLKLLYTIYMSWAWFIVFVFLFLVKYLRAQCPDSLAHYINQFINHSLFDWTCNHVPSWPNLL